MEGFTHAMRAQGMGTTRNACTMHGHDTQCAHNARAMQPTWDHRVRPGQAPVCPDSGCGRSHV